ncbi:MAG: hypothetical protein WB800_34485, partial [Streptosporangiaceae bacterium]
GGDAGPRPEPGPGDDATFGSQPTPRAPHEAPAPSRGPRLASGRARTRRRRVHLAIWSAAAAAVLLGAGTAIGVVVAGSQQQQLPPPPPTSTILVPASQAALSARQAGRPQIAPYQRFGDSNTVFVIHGEGWKPGEKITVALSGHASPVHPIVDDAGTFNYAINQDHEFFRGGLPAGTYQVLVTAPGGARAKASFTVRSSGPGGPGGPGQPPGGQGPPAG